jgi:hypothetical protein
LAWVLRSSKGSTAAPSRASRCITAWYGNCSASDRKALQRMVRMAQYITGSSFLPPRTSTMPKNLAKTPATLVIDCSVCYRTANGTGVPSLASKQLLPPSHKTPEHLIKWLPRLFALSLPLFYTTATFCCYNLCIVTLITLPTCTYYLN